ncbi:ABC transporter ATP-binding protein [Clostridium butanoliproducens]|uniref:ABC transporter ATP-binding protein n=1 Tax=Clostridium butanoliproducens TaxID=2991837 RepID=UPI0024BADFE6|nr:ABC transporter transmembrane domain-containing protein [Clostridium butanoliproducens]MDU1348752.1 ABC transporter transmembrane domain-containing protein [Clostridium argentinense]
MKGYKCKFSNIYKIYREFVYKYIYYQIKILFFVIISSVLLLINPYIFKLIIDKALIIRNEKNLILFAGVFSICYFFNRVISIFLSKNLSFLRNRLDYDLSLALLENILKQNSYFFQKMRTGEILQRVLNEVTNVKNIFTDLIINLITQLVTFIIVAIIMFRLNVKLTLISLILVPLIYLHFKYFNPKIRSTQKQTRMETAMLTNVLQEHIQGIDVIKVFHKEKFTLLKYGQALHKVILKYVDMVYWQTLSQQILSLLYILSPITLLVLGGKSVISGKMSIGEFVAFYTYISKLYSPIKAITDINIEIQKANIAVERFVEIYYKDSDDRVQSIAKSKLINQIEIKNLSYSHPKNKELFSNLNFKLKKGNMICIIGKNGTGKTTLLNILMGIYKDYKGEICIDGVNICNINWKNKAKLFSIVPQNSYLFNNLSIYENITFKKNCKDKNEITKLAKILNIYDYIIGLENGYQTIVTKNGDGFSSGQKQKIAILRGLYNNADIIILDESTSAFDIVSEKIFFNYLESIKRDKLILYISHNKELIHYADDVIDLDQFN